MSTIDAYAPEQGDPGAGLVIIPDADLVITPAEARALAATFVSLAEFAEAQVRVKVEHTHRFQGQTLVHTHDESEVGRGLTMETHGYFGHIEDNPKSEVGRREVPPLLGVDCIGSYVHGVIGEVASTQTGNTIFRIGEVGDAHGTMWHQTAYVVLSPAERDRLIGTLVAMREAVSV